MQPPATRRGEARASVVDSPCMRSAAARWDHAEGQDAPPSCIEEGLCPAGDPVFLGAVPGGTAELPLYRVRAAKVCRNRGILRSGRSLEYRHRVCHPNRSTQSLPNWYLGPMACFRYNAGANVVNCEWFTGQLPAFHGVTPDRSQDASVTKGLMIPRRTVSRYT